jgi:CheY-like chemotaxis protein
VARWSGADLGAILARTASKRRTQRSSSCAPERGAHMTTNGSEGQYILIVEDDADLRSVEAEVLGAEGFDVRTASDGIEALEAIETSGTPALILLDLRMPRLNGWDLAARLRSNEKLRSVPIVVVAAHLAIAQEAAVIGARAWLHKPVSIDHLLSVVRSIFGEPRGEAAL